MQPVFSSQFFLRNTINTTNKMLRECIHDRRTPITMHPVTRVNTDDPDARSIKMLDSLDTTESSGMCSHLSRRFCTRSSVANCSALAEPHRILLGSLGSGQDKLLHFISRLTLFVDSVIRTTINKTGVAITSFLKHGPRRAELLTHI